MVIEILGIRTYALGLYTACGAVCAVTVIGVLGASLGLKRGSASLIVLLSALCGLVFSRLAFCLAYRVSGRMIPLSLWPKVTGGGWSLAGFLFGTMAGGWASARMTGEKTVRVADVLSCALLPLIAAERMGEARISGGAPGTVFRISAAAALILFMALLVILARKREADGTLTVVFLILAGGGTIVLEGLREERFLPVGPMSLLQIAGAVMLAAGLLAAVLRGLNGRRGTRAER